MSSGLLRLSALVLFGAAPWTATAQASGSVADIAPVLDAHQHLRSPAAAAHGSDIPPPRVSLPPDLGAFLDARIKAEQDKSALAGLYVEHAWLLQSFDPAWVQTKDSIADWWVGATDAPYGLEPVGYGMNGNAAYITGYLTDLKTGHRDAHIAYSLTKSSDNRWRIMTEVLTMGEPRTVAPVTADFLVPLLDSARIQRALVLSIAYQFGEGRDEKPNEWPQVRAENDWTAEQVAKYPSRLRAFCSFNPLKSYALQELDRCARSGKFRGIKLHFGNSGVDLTNAADVEKVRKAFAAANENHLPVVVHFPPNGAPFGRAYAQTFIDKVLPSAPNIPIQIAHLGSAGRLDPRADSALAVFAEGIQARDPRMKNLWFDVATAVTPQISRKNAELVASRIRQIGVERILYGSDTPDKDHMTPAEGWAAFRDRLPLTPDELRTIADNVPPYAQ
ncbi:MAG: amidohydrolase family protein [Gemmatimonadaceae bacterium]